MKRIIRYLLGILFIILGALGMFLPVLQGILFLIIGLLILAPESRFIKRHLVKLRKKYPTLFSKAKHIKTKFTGIIKKK